MFIRFKLLGESHLTPKSDLKRCNYCVGPLRLFALCHNFHANQAHFSQNWEMTCTWSWQFSWDSPWRWWKHPHYYQSKQLCDWVCVYQCSHALCLCFFGGEFPARVFLMVCGWQISNKRCVTLRFECPTLRYFFPKTLNSDCLEVIKNPNTHTKEKKLINSTNVINSLALLEVLNS